MKWHGLDGGQFQVSETDHILFDTTARLFQSVVTPEILESAGRGVWPQAVWQGVEELGLPLALVPEEQGGFGVDPLEALGVVRIAAQFALPLPLAETMLANRILGAAGLTLPEGALTVAPTQRDDALSLRRDGNGWHLGGTARRVPWGRDAAAVVVVATDAEGAFWVALVPSGAFAVALGDNLAGEPRDDLSFDVRLPAEAVAPAPDGFDAEGVRLAGAALRAIQMAGAMGRLLDMTVDYANERVQFGRPIGKFQAVQQSLAVLAGLAAVSSGAADLAAEALAESLDPLRIAVAKARTAEAATTAAAIAHQVHGAIGFTHEHSLHTVTRRLWSWRDEFGGEALWNRRIGQAVALGGADALWPMIAAA